MVEHALEEDPNECCGLLGGRDGELLKHYRITNTEHSPFRYNMAGKELLLASNEIDDNGWEIKVIYHSHTHSPAYPSKTDVAAVVYPDSYYLIVSLGEQDDKGELARKDPPELRIFRIVEGTVSEEPVVIV